VAEASRPRYGALFPACQKQATTGTRRVRQSPVGQEGRQNFSARYIKIATDSKTWLGVGPLWSTRTGILELRAQRNEGRSRTDSPRSILISPSVVFCTTMAKPPNSFLKHHGHLHTVRRSLRIELQRVTADWEFPCRASDREIGRFMFSNRPPFGFIPTPNFSVAYNRTRWPSLRLQEFGGGIRV